MGKIIAICGKICCGKSYYSNKLKEKEKAVILSCDELTGVVFDNNLGDKHDQICQRIHKYLLQKAVDIVRANGNVILDWGFWSKVERKNISEYFAEKGIVCQWHYIDIDDQSWKRNISERNQRITEGRGGYDFYLDEGLMQKLMSKWQAPLEEEIDVWVHLHR